MPDPVVGIDLRNVAGSSRGYRRMMNLFRELDRLESSYEFEWITEPTPLTRAIDLSDRTSLVHPRKRMRLMHRPVLGHLRPLIWEETEVLHFPTADCWSVPTCKTVVTLHDLAPLHYPEWFFSGPSEERQYREHLDTIFEVADRVVTVSEYSRKDLIAAYPQCEPKLRMVYQGVGPEFFVEDWTADRADLFRSNVGAPEGYLLYCGGIDARKNVEFLLEVFEELARDRSFRKKLIVAGGVDGAKRGMGNLRAAAEEKGLADRVLFPGWVSDEFLRRLYNPADLFLFPSLMEGFGYAPLEAMSCACPTLCSNATSLPETVGEASLTLPPTDRDAWVQSIRNLLGDEERMDDYREKGLEWVKSYDWVETAKGFLGVYGEMVGGECEARKAPTKPQQNESL